MFLPLTFALQALTVTGLLAKPLKAYHFEKNDVNLQNLYFVKKPIITLFKPLTNCVCGGIYCFHGRTNRQTFQHFGFMGYSNVKFP